MFPNHSPYLSSPRGASYNSPGHFGGTSATYAAHQLHFTQPAPTNHHHAPYSSSFAAAATAAPWVTHGGSPPPGHHHAASWTTAPAVTHGGSPSPGHHHAASWTTAPAVSYGGSPSPGHHHAASWTTAPAVSSDGISMQHLHAQAAHSPANLDGHILFPSHLLHAATHPNSTSELGTTSGYPHPATATHGDFSYGTYSPAPGAALDTTLTPPRALDSYELPPPVGRAVQRSATTEVHAQGDRPNEPNAWDFPPSDYADGNTDAGISASSAPGAPLEAPSRSARTAATTGLVQHTVPAAPLLERPASPIPGRGPHCDLPPGLCSDSSFRADYSQTAHPSPQGASDPPSALDRMVSCTARVSEMLQEPTTWQLPVAVDSEVVSNPVPASRVPAPAPSYDEVVSNPVPASPMLVSSPSYDRLLLSVPDEMKTDPASTKVDVSPGALRDLICDFLQESIQYQGNLSNVVDPTVSLSSPRVHNALVRHTCISHVGGPGKGCSTGDSRPMCLGVVAAPSSVPADVAALNFLQLQVPNGASPPPQSRAPCGALANSPPPRNFSPRRPSPPPESNFLPPQLKGFLEMKNAGAFGPLVDPTVNLPLGVGESVLEWRKRKADSPVKNSSKQIECCNLAIPSNRRDSHGAAHGLHTAPTGPARMKPPPRHTSPQRVQFHKEEQTLSSSPHPSSAPRCYPKESLLSAYKVGKATPTANAAGVALPCYTTDDSNPYPPNTRNGATALALMSMTRSDQKTRGTPCAPACELYEPGSNVASPSVAWNLPRTPPRSPRRSQSRQLPSPKCSASRGVSGAALSPAMSHTDHFSPASRFAQTHARSQHHSPAHSHSVRPTM